MEPVGKFLLSKEPLITQSSLHRKTRLSHVFEMPDSGCLEKPDPSSFLR